MGPHRLPALAYLRPLLGHSPAQARAMVEAGNCVVAQDLSRDGAISMVAELTRLGAQAQVAVCSCGCSNAPDHY